MAGLNLRRCFVFCCAVACLSSPNFAPGQTLAFPEAEGFGRFATGARTNLSSATVYHVTNLNDSGAGSFRDAVSQSNRFVVFDVGGIVNISSVIPVKSNVTIAGQTAPGGITFYGDRLSFTSADNAISRYIAVRKGNAGVRADALSLARGSNMIFDHMSVTWGVDETFSINPDSGFVIDNITIQNTIIAQGQDRLGHSAGGLMTLSEGRKFSVIKSLFTDNVTRNPKVRGENEFINNVVYGWETAAYIMGDTSATSHANAIGNYFIEGPVNGGSPFSSGTATFHIYGSDNWVDADRDGVLDGTLVTSYPGADVVSTPFAFPTTATMTAQQALPHVLANVGLSITRDAVDTRIVQEVASYGTFGGVIQRETDLFPAFGTDPKYVNFRARLTDGDNDGMADNWEVAHGLSPANATDWKTLNAGGYTRLEEYVNELGAFGATVTSTGGDWTTPASWSGGTPTLANIASASGTLNVATGNSFARRLALNGTLNVNGGTLDVFDSATVNGSVSVTGGIATFGQLLFGQGGSLVLRTGGTLQSGTISATVGTATFDWNGGTIRATGVPNVALLTTLGASGGTFDTTGYSGVFSGRITGEGTLTKIGAGTLTLSGNNAFTGGTNVTGNLKLAHNSAAGTGALTINAAGGAVQLANGVTVVNNIVTNYNFEMLDVPDANGNATFTGNITRGTSGQIRLQATGTGATLNLSGAIDAGAQNFIVKIGNVVLKGNGSISGNGGAIGRTTGATTLTLEDNAVFNIGGFSMGGGQPLTNATINVRGPATLSTGSGNLDLLSTSTATAASSLNLDGGLTTVNGFVKTSIGATQTSIINLNGGTLRYGGSAANTNFLPMLAGLTVNVRAGGARIDDNGQAITVAEPLLHDSAMGATLDGGLRKLGAGTLFLNATNTYTGATTIDGGTLRVNGSIAGAATVNSGGVLGGAGGIAGLVTVANSGTLAPGNSAGTLTVGSLNLSAGAQTLMELGGLSQYDAILAGGNITFGGTLNVSSLTPFSPALGNSFDLFNWGSKSGTFSSVTLPPLSPGLAWSRTKLYSSGEIFVVDANFQPGDANRDGAVTGADVQELLRALNDLAAYQANHGPGGSALSNQQLTQLLDLNGDDPVTNRDIQGLLNYLANGGGSLVAVPEPSSFGLTVLGLFGALMLQRRRLG